MTMQFQASLATRTAFFVAGFVIAGFAPLVPFAKANLGVDDRILGALLLCLGLGSMVAMPLTGRWSARFGAAPFIRLGGLMMGLALIPIAAIDNPMLFACDLFILGAGLGMIDVAMNLHAVQFEERFQRAAMSGFHAFYSLGGLSGAGSMTLAMAAGVPPGLAAVGGGCIGLLAIIAVWGGFLHLPGAEPARLHLPRGRVILLAYVAMVAFLIDGAIVNWGSLFLQAREVGVERWGGSSYVAFALAALASRTVGDRLTRSLGYLRLLWGASGVALCGFAVLSVSPGALGALAGFALIGLGVAHFPPVAFALAGRQKVMPAGAAIAALTTIGYGGTLVGPPILGALAQQIGLVSAVTGLAVLPLLVPFLARAAVGKG